ncbi:hypothetical protein Tco_1439110 [Tanacetum coccineum]
MVKGKIKTGKLDFEDVCFVKELQHFNLFSVSQMCDKKNKVLFTDSECLVLSPEFKLPDENKLLQQEKQTEHPNSTNSINTVSTPVSTAGPSLDNTAGPSLDNTAGTIDSTANVFEEHLFA